MVAWFDLPPDHPAHAVLDEAGLPPATDGELILRRVNTADGRKTAWVNDRRLRVSARRDMMQMIFATGLPFGGRPDLPQTMRDLARILPGCAGVRRWGAASLDLAYVAAGRYDGFWERGLKPWDMAAGLLLVKEAGGFTEPLVGETIFGSGTVIAANDQVFDSLAKLLRDDA